MQREGRKVKAADEPARQPSAAKRSPAQDGIHTGPRMLAQREQIRRLFGDTAQLRSCAMPDPATVQRRVYEATVNRASDAVRMSPQGSILHGEVYHRLGIGEFVRVDDQDKWRSRRGTTAAATASSNRWLGVRRLGTVDVSGVPVYVNDGVIEEASELESHYIGKALVLQDRHRAEVDREVDRICTLLELDRTNELMPSNPAHVVLYFAWLAKIGDHLSTLFPGLQAFVSQRIGEIAATPSTEQLNENSVEGMALDRALIEPINVRLKVWAKMLAGDGSEVIESLIDGSGGGLHMGEAMQNVQSGRTHLLHTVADYLRLGQRAIDRALAHNDKAWTLELRKTLESVSGCYAAQAQAVERVQPRKEEEKLFDPKYKDWALSAGEVGTMGLVKKGKDVESIDDLQVGDLVSSEYVNVGFMYEVVAKTDDGVKLQAKR